MLSTSHVNPSARYDVHGSKRRCHDGDARPNLLPVFRPLIVADAIPNVEEGNYRAAKADRIFDQHVDCLHDFPSAPFPIAHHFHVSKRGADRKLVEALGQNVATYSLIAAVTILSVFAVLSVGAVFAMERSAVEQARI